MNDLHHRHSIRLPGYDYSQAGAYCVTICSHNRECLFGEIVGAQMRLNVYGTLVQNTWDDLIHHVAGIELGEFVVMPNHVHGIIIIHNVVGAGSKPAPTNLPEIVRQLKTFSSRKINIQRGTAGVAVWQRNYYEHIIRSDADLERVQAYIHVNPLRWELDREHPERIDL